MQSPRTFELETARLVMRPHKLSDVAFMVDLNSDPEVTKFVGGETMSSERALEIINSLALQFKEKRIGRFIVIEKKSNTPVGWCGLKWIPERKVVDVGYRFLKKSWGNGYATEAAGESLRYGFCERNLELIYAGAHPDNFASIKILKKLGMTEIGRRIEEGEEYIDFKISQTEFRELAQAR